jgi:hypothetical protein
MVQWRAQKTGPGAGPGRGLMIRRWDQNDQRMPKRAFQRDLRLSICQ